MAKIRRASSGRFIRRKKTRVKRRKRRTAISVAGLDGLPGGKCSVVKIRICRGKNGRIRSATKVGGRTTGSTKCRFGRNKRTHKCLKTKRRRR